MTGFPVGREASAVARQLDPTRVAALHAREERTFLERHPRSRELHERAKGSLLGGVPMPWMTEWPGAYPIFVDEARGARFTDVDGNTYVDLCLGDTGAMTGHAPEPVLRALAERAPKGITTMLPGEDAVAAVKEFSASAPDSVRSDWKVLADTFAELEKAWLAQGAPRLLLITPISASKRHIPYDEFQRALKLPRAAHTLVYVDDAHMASRISLTQVRRFGASPRTAVAAVRRKLDTEMPGTSTGYCMARNSPARARSSTLMSNTSAPSRVTVPPVTWYLGWPAMA